MDKPMKGLESLFPIWQALNDAQRAKLLIDATPRSVEKYTVLMNGSADCVGLFLIESGQLRTYIVSDEGKEITLYRLFERDICLFSASCLIASLQFDIWVEAEKQSRFWVLPVSTYENLMESSPVVANYTSELMASRFSEVMWLMEQILFKRFDSRLASFLLDESAVEGTLALSLTHERIANHLGTAREVVTRMLKYFQEEGMVKLARGKVCLINEQKLNKLIT